MLHLQCMYADHTIYLVGGLSPFQTYEFMSSLGFSSFPKPNEACEKGTQKHKPNHTLGLAKKKPRENEKTIPEERLGRLKQKRKITQKRENNT